MVLLLFHVRFTSSSQRAANGMVMRDVSGSRASMKLALTCFHLDERFPLTQKLTQKERYSGPFRFIVMWGLMCMCWNVEKLELSFTLFFNYRPCKN